MDSQFQNNSSQEQPSIIIGSVPVQHGQVSLVNRQSLNIKVIRGLAITEMVIGSLTVIFGVAVIPSTSVRFWLNQTGSGIWFGIWILVSGIIGFFSAKHHHNRCLNGTNMGFNIVCSVFSLCLATMYATAISYFAHCRVYHLERERVSKNYYYYGYTSSRYDNEKNYYYRTRWYGSRVCQNKDAGVGLHSVLLILMLAEFAVSLTVSIYCCRSLCCSNSCCSSCCQSPSGTSQQAVRYHVTPGPNGQSLSTANTGYHQVSYPGTVIQAVNHQQFPVHGQMLVSQPTNIVMPSGYVTQQAGVIHEFPQQRP